MIGVHRVTRETLHPAQTQRPSTRCRLWVAGDVDRHFGRADDIILANGSSNHKTDLRYTRRCTGPPSPPATCFTLDTIRTGMTGPTAGLCPPAPEGRPTFRFASQGPTARRWEGHVRLSEWRFPSITQAAAGTREMTGQAPERHCRIVSTDSSTTTCLGPLHATTDDLRNSSTVCDVMMMRRGGLT